MSNRRRMTTARRRFRRACQWWETWFFGTAAVAGILVGGYVFLFLRPPLPDTPQIDTRTPAEVLTDAHPVGDFAGWHPVD